VRKTKQREAIVEELMKLRTHPSADEIYERVKKRIPRISLGTVYRNLEILSREGIIQRLEIGGSQMRFDGERTEHQHIRCVRCGRIEDVASVPRLSAHERGVIRRTGYRLLERRVEFLGLCPACGKKAGER
jgi:Fe2+ or Zn2+ uptake regulation protein